jgi:hypothetical protein
MRAQGAGLPEAARSIPTGLASRSAPILEVIIDFCARQKLIARPIAVDDLFDDTTRKLGAA